MAKLICGINEISNDMFNGKTIEEVIASAGPLLNLPERSNLVILVNDEESDASHVIAADDEVEFVKAAGEKG